jgi:biopolymer transport protein ExbD/biopolymer transport protein TolR
LIRSRRRRRGPAREAAGEVRAEINVTPLVDVVLVLLIIFMVVTPMLQRGMDVRLPESRHHQTENDTGEQLTVSVRADGSVWLARERADPARLESLLKDALARNPGRPIYLKGDTRLRYGKVRDVMLACHRAGSQQVALATEEEK